MRRNPVQIIGIGALALTLSLASACGDDDPAGPVEIGIDPVATATAMDQLVNQFIESNPAVQSINSFAPQIFDALNPGTSSVVLQLLPSREDRTLLGMASRIRASVEPVPTTFGIPAELQGVWIFVLGQGYVLDPDRAGEAPENTARFTLYEVTPEGDPVVPLVEIGHLDITDLSELPTIDIDLTAVVGEETPVDLAVTGSLTRNATQINLDLDMAGFLAAGTEQRDIAIDVNALATSTSVSTTVNFSLPVGDVTAGFSFTQELSAIEITTDVTLTFTDGTDTIRYQVDTDGEVIGDQVILNILSGSVVTFNDRTVARISGTLENPVFNNAAGNPLTEDELQAVATLFEAMTDLFETFESFLDVVSGVLALGA